jgi:hypothetical protein
MILPLLVVPLVSLLTQPPEPETIARAFGDPRPGRPDDKKS